MTERIVRLKIQLDDIKPSIWRQVDVSSTTNLRALHDLIQAIMPWENYHLYHFEIGDRVYGEPVPEDKLWGRNIYHAKSLRLGALLDRGVTRFNYTYDFGDDWRHSVEIESVAETIPETDYPRFLAGEGRAPPEDVGGPHGYMEFVEAMSKRNHPRHKELAGWYGGPFNPLDMDTANIDRQISDIVKRRKVALAAHQRSRTNS